MKDHSDPITVLCNDEDERTRAGSSWKTLTFDASHYEHLLEDEDIDDAAKHEFLAMMWNIMVCFVDLGFEVKLKEDGEQNCGQSSVGAEASGEAMLDCLSTQKIKEVFAAATAAGEVDSKTKTEEKV